MEIKMKTTQVKQDPETGEFYFDLEDLKEFIDIEKVEFYSLEHKEDKTIVLKFFDKDKNEIKVAKQDK